MIRPQRCRTFKKHIAVYEPKLCSDCVALIIETIRTSCNETVSENSCVVRHDLGFIACTLTVDNAFPTAASAHMCLQANHASRVTPHTFNFARTPAERQTTHGMCASVQPSPVKVVINSRITLSKHGFGDEPLAFASSGNISRR